VPLALPGPLCATPRIARYSVRLDSLKMISAPAAMARAVACPEHPTFQPVGTCSRCGRFVCARCETWGDCCAACEYRRLRELPSLRVRGYLAQAFLALAAVGLSLGAALDGWLISQLHGGMASSDASGTYDRLSTLLAMPTLVAFGLSALFFLRWLHLAVRTAKMLGLEPGTTPAWAVVWWFIPLAHLYDPYLVVRGLCLSLGGARKTSAAVTAWWTAWVLGGAAWLVQLYLFQTLDSEPLLLTSALLAGFTAQLILALGALLGMAVIGQVQALTDECVEDVAEAA